MKNIFADGFKTLMNMVLNQSDSSRTYGQEVHLTDMQANNIYSSNWLARKVVDIPVDDAMRNGRRIISIEDPEKIKLINKIYRDMRVNEKIRQALIWSRLFGSSFIVLISEEDQSIPFNIKKDLLKNIIVLDKQFILPLDPDMNVLSPNFGESEFYSITESTENLHFTRVIHCRENMPTIYDLRSNYFYGKSIYTYLYDSISDCDRISKAISYLVEEAAIDVYRVEGLNQLVAAGQEEIILNRFKIGNRLKSFVRAFVLDKKDEYEKKTYNFTGLPEIDDRAIQKIAGGSNIPVTRLIGISPGGMNATGESDQKNYNQFVVSIQDNKLRKVYDAIDKVMMRTFFNEEPFEYEFKPLETQSDLELADIGLKNSQTDQVYYSMGSLNEMEILKELVARKHYKSITTKTIEEKEKEKEAEIIEYKKLLEKSEEMEDPNIDEEK